MTAESMTQTPAAPSMERFEATPPVSAFGNPVPLGLFAYGMTVCVLSLANIGYYPIDAMVLSMVVIFGGLAEVIVSLIEARRGETFTTTVFGGLGFLFLTWGFLLIGSQHGWWAAPAGTTATGWYLITWSVFALAVTVASMMAPRTITAILGLSTALLVVVGIATWTTNDGLTKFAGWWGLATGALSVLTGFGLLVNESFRRDVLPVGAPMIATTARHAASPPRPRSYAG